MLLRLVICDGKDCEVEVRLPGNVAGVALPEGWERDPPYVHKSRGAKFGGKVRHYCPSCKAARKKKRAEES